MSAGAAAAVEPRSPQEAARSTRALLGPAVLRSVWFAAAMGVFCNVGSLAVPLFNMQIFNRVLTTRDHATLWAMLAGLVGALAVYVTLDRLRGEALAALGERIARRLSLPALRATAASPGGGATQALRDIETLREFLAGPACVTPFDLIWAPVMLLVLLGLHWGYAALGAICLAILASLNVLGDALSRRQMLAAAEARAQGYTAVASAIRAAPAVVAMGMLDTLASRWDGDQRAALGTVRRALAAARITSSATRALRLGMTGCMVALGLVLAINGLASSGSMVAGNMILARLLQPFEQISTTRRQWIAALAAWRRLRETLGQAVPARYTAPLPRPAGHLVVERLVHMQPGADRPALRGISFTLLPGRVLGVIGPSGAGKSTLLRLLMGMTEPMAGGVYLDGHSTFLWEREDFCRHVGYVPQSAALADASVADNIARLQTPDLSRVIAAAKLAGVHETIASLPHGYATRVAGGVLSAGQRQRVALARALYTDPCLLVLDEPSAFFDEAGEAMLTALLSRLRTQGTGAIVATHRPAVLAAADALLVLREGVVEQFGPRAEVLHALQGPRIRLLPAARSAAS